MDHEVHCRILDAARELLDNGGNVKTMRFKAMTAGPGFMDLSGARPLPSTAEAVTAALGDLRL